MTIDGIEVEIRYKIPIQVEGKNLGCKTIVSGATYTTLQKQVHIAIYLTSSKQIPYLNSIYDI